MQIIGLKKYSHGYSGCLSTDTEYVFFYFTKGRCKTYLRYQKSDFLNDDHFISVMAKFVQTSFFSRAQLTVDEVDSCVKAHFRHLQKAQMGSRSERAPSSSLPLPNGRYPNPVPPAAG